MPARVCVALWLLAFAGCQAPSVTTAPVASPAPAPVAATPRDAFVLLSGGGTPASNNYSQFLQARAVAAYLREQYPPEAVWVFFGVGNRTGAPPALADV